ncbi:ABC transporter permease [Pseudonocardia asaccharolytica]|uniref:ABC transporter substrate-binding protein n=1 Tax=Pseudonocardia asaccharolytica DSM 44247 = NBRC 16224 TaxID=1123024 RepID=A0A511D7E1_9PSEU|nr:FtsX-like permease family protein [Pseudonocardia asaccharolytica]GEL20731.1 ABC transporter substrate-binding protein [Pseudonocardia asaccharolytica DSM 44247 = NBRC 16224]
MFVAWRDLRFARGRFALMASVVVLITMLVGLLSGLTAGLARDTTSAVTDLPADHLVFAAPPDGQQPSFTSSSIDRDLWQRWAEVPGVRAAEPLGITTGYAESGEATAAVTAFGVRPDSPLAPLPSAVGSGTALLSTGAADALGVGTGDAVTLAGQRLRVEAVDVDASYSHMPVIWTNLATWQQLARTDSATVLALTTDAGTDLAAADAALGTLTLTRTDALSAIGSYTAENGSLQLMRGLLFAISALVIGAFFTVWTIQRSGDIAVLKALGAGTGHLLRDALGQALVLLVGGTAIGTGLAAALGALAAETVPFVLDIGTIAIPAAILVVLGLLGAALAVRRITAVDPLTALSAR